MPPITVLLKPASGRCNMRCRYCFYSDEMKSRETADLGLMDDETMEAVVRGCLDFAEGSCSFGFQGGEPTLRGLDFFRRFTALAQKLRPDGLRLSYFLQTNGLALNAEWAEFLKENRFLVGLSLDGDKAAHDALRPDAAGKGTFTRALAAARLLEKYGVEYSTLTVVTANTARYVRHIYRFFVKNGLTRQQYIPCLDPLGEERGSRPWSLTAEAYGDFLIALFDEWRADAMAGRRVYIRYFDNLMSLMLGGKPESCGMSGVCPASTVVEADGSVYPCDFYVLDEYRLGSFRTDTFEKINARRDASGFLRESREGLEACAACRWYRLCRGGCRRDRQAPALHSVGGNYFCSAYRRFFAHAVPLLDEMLPRP